MSGNQNDSGLTEAPARPASHEAYQTFMTLLNGHLNDAQRADLATAIGRPTAEAALNAPAAQRPTLQREASVRVTAALSVLSGEERDRLQRAYKDMMAEIGENVVNGHAPNADSLQARRYLQNVLQNSQVIPTPSTSAVAPQQTSPLEHLGNINKPSIQGYNNQMEIRQQGGNNPPVR